MKIGICGAPSSGKTTLAAMLYTDLLMSGIEGAYLIHEYAKEWLASGNKFTSLSDQYTVSEQQAIREEHIRVTSFDPVVCDSCVWLGGVYVELMDLEPTEAMQKYLVHVNSYEYDVTIFVPLPSNESNLNEFRVHDADQSKQIQELILEKLKTKKNVIDAPKNFKDRAQFIQDLKRGI